MTQLIFLCEMVISSGIFFFVGETFYQRKKMPVLNVFSFRTNSIMSAVPPELLQCSLLTVSTKTLLSHAQLTSHLLISIDMFGLRLLKCYSYPFTLRSSHCPSLTGNDNGYYFSSSSPFSDYLTILVIITHGFVLVNIFLMISQMVICLS